MSAAPTITFADKRSLQFLYHYEVNELKRVINAHAALLDSASTGGPAQLYRGLTLAAAQDLLTTTSVVPGLLYGITGAWNGATASTVYVLGLNAGAYSVAGVLLAGNVYSSVLVDVAAGTTAIDAQGYTDEQINALLAGKVSAPVGANLGTVRESLSQDNGEYEPGRRYGIVGGWNGGPSSTVYVTALQDNLFDTRGTQLMSDGRLLTVTVNVPAGTTTPVASYAVQQQHTQQLATVAVQASPVYGFLVAGGQPVGYASLDEALADPAAKISYQFNAPVLTLTTSNPADGSGWAYAVAGVGRSLLLGNNVKLTLPGNDSGTLIFQDFYIGQAAGTRSGRVRLLTTAPTTTPPALLPRLSGTCTVPLELTNGGAVLASGYYVRIDGTGTVYALPPFLADSVAAGVTIIPVGGGGAGTVKTVNGTAPDAAGNVALATRDVNGYSQAKRQQVFQLFTSPTQFKAVDVPLDGDTSTGENSVIPDYANGDLYTLLRDPDNRGADGFGTLTWMRTSFS